MKFLYQPAVHRPFSSVPIYFQTSPSVSLRFSRLLCSLYGYIPVSVTENFRNGPWLVAFYLWAMGKRLAFHSRAFVSRHSFWSHISPEH